MLGVPVGYWGKLARNQNPRQWHPLWCHALDVAFCLEALLSHSLLGQRLAQAGGLVRLPPILCARLALLAGWHDLGKFTHPFQRRAFTIPAMPGPRGGHLAEGWFLIRECFPGREALLQAMGLPGMVSWFEDEAAAFGLLAVILAHHGRPLPKGQRLSRDIWSRRDSWDPVAGIGFLARQLHRAFPAAFSQGGPLLPDAPAFQHLFMGLVTLADWIASDSQRFFPFWDGRGDYLSRSRRRACRAVVGLHLAPMATRRRMGAREDDFARLFGHGARRPLQEAMGQLDPPVAGRITLLEAETGSGKTEAALLHFLDLFRTGRVDGLYFALPTRAAAVQIHQRIVRAVARFFGPGRGTPPVLLAVPGYLRVDDHEGVRLAPFETLWPDDVHGRIRHDAWAVEHPKRYLAAPIAVGTIDQALLASLQVSHAHMRFAALSRLLVVVDEVHASDTYMTTLLGHLVGSLLPLGGQFLLMSATLATTARQRLLEPDKPRPSGSSSRDPLPYPLLTTRDHGHPPILRPLADNGREKRVAVELRSVPDPGEVATLAREGARVGAMVLVIRNTVALAMATQVALESLAPATMPFACRGRPAPHHGRFAAVDRKLLDLAVEESFGKEADRVAGRVLVATQTVEQSLDLDADLLITDLCPMDVLLQRVGRLHRHAGRKRPAGFEQPRVVVLSPSETELSRLLTPTGEVRGGGGGLGTVYPDLRVAAATRALLATHNPLLLPGQNRKLVESALDPEGLDALARQLGAAWQTHGQKQDGIRAASATLGRLNLLCLDTPLWREDYPFCDPGQREMRTRLGLDDRRALFPNSPTGPFGEGIEALPLPFWMIRHLELPEDPTVGESHPLPEGGFRFRLGDGNFLYDRMGLRLDQERNTP